MSEQRFPFYIPSKSRWDNFLTPKYLDKMGVAYKVVVEPDQYKRYLSALGGDKNKVLVLDMSYKEKYELCDNEGLSRSTGSGPARNFIWDHSVSEGYSHHWIMDDNIAGYYRYNKNMKIPCSSFSFWVAMEDFMLRYKNVAMAGPNYEMFCPRKAKAPPFTVNTRIYSCNFIRNDIPFRWRGRYNEDTILSLDILKAGWCTILFKAFLQNKMATQLMRGGNTEEVYGDGTDKKSQMMVDTHPDVSRVVTKFGRIHHHVDYRGFKKNKLIKRDGLKIQKGVNNYGMSLIKK